MSQDPQKPGADQGEVGPRPPPVISLHLGSREDCIATLERIGRVALSGKLKETQVRQLCMVVREALAVCPESGKGSTRVNRISTASREAEIRAGQPEAEPEPAPTEPEPDDEPSFDERIRAAERARRAGV